MGAVLRIGVTEHPRQAAHRAAHRHGAVGTPHHIFALLAETPFLWAAGHLIPHHAAPPNPSGPLQSVGDGGVLPPIDEQADRRTWLAGFAGIVQPLGHPAGPASLIPIVPVEVGRSVLGVHAAVLLCGRAVFLCGFPAARSIGRVGDEGIEHLGLERTDDLQGIPMQNGPSIPAAVLDGQSGFFYNLSKFVLLVQRHHPFCFVFTVPHPDGAF